MNNELKKNQYPITKTVFKDALACPKAVWLSWNKPWAVLNEDELNDKALQGIEIGKLAAELFHGNFCEIPTDIPEAERIQLTKEAIDNGADVIAEAAFGYGDCYCAVDFLEVTRKDGEVILSINEIKAHGDNDNDKIAVSITDKYDLAFQHYVIESADYYVEDANLYCLNSDYVKDGDLDLTKLFKKINLTDDVMDLMCPTFTTGRSEIESKIEEVSKALFSPTEPNVPLEYSCKKCPCYTYCARELHSRIPEGETVFDMPGMFWKKMNKLYHNYNVESLEEAVPFIEEEIRALEVKLKKARTEKSIRKNKDSILSLKNLLAQIDIELNGGNIVNKDKIKKWIYSIEYPIYFLDFETYQDAIPVFDGQWPWEQTCFQYSLDIMDSPEGPIKHYEYLGESGRDNRKEICKNLCELIGDKGTIIAYNIAFEKSRIKEFAEMYEDYSEKCNHMLDMFKDLIDPFKKVWIYNDKMHCRSSIKVTLPAMLPGDKSLDYKELPGVQNGTETMTIYRRLQDMSPEEREVTRAYMLRYCNLDTFAMVKLFGELLRIIDDPNYEAFNNACEEFHKGRLKKYAEEDKNLELLI